MKMEYLVINPLFPKWDPLLPTVERKKWILPNHRMANQVMMRQIQKLDPFQAWEENRRSEEEREEEEAERWIFEESRVQRETMALAEVARKRNLWK
jgi:hypothetical protein